MIDRGFEAFFGTATDADYSIEEKGAASGYRLKRVCSLTEYGNKIMLTGSVQ